MTDYANGMSRRNFLRIGAALGTALGAAGCGIPMREFDSYDAPTRDALRKSSLGGMTLGEYRAHLLSSWKDPQVIATPAFKAGEVQAYFKAKAGDNEAFALTEATKKLNDMAAQAGTVAKARPHQVGAAFDAAGWGNSFLYHVAKGNKDPDTRKKAQGEVEKYLSENASLASTVDENIRKLDRQLDDMEKYQHRVVALSTYDHPAVKETVAAYKQNISTLGAHEALIYSINVAEGLWPFLLDNVDRVDNLHQALVNQGLRAQGRVELKQQVSYDGKQMSVDELGQKMIKLAKEYYADDSDNLADKVMRNCRSPFMYTVLSQLTNPRKADKRITTDAHRGLALIMDQELAKASHTEANTAYRILATAADAVITPVTLVNLFSDLSYAGLPETGLGETYDENALDGAIGDVIDVTQGLNDPKWYVSNKKQIGPRVLLRVIALLLQGAAYGGIAYRLANRGGSGGGQGGFGVGGGQQGGDGLK
ncbi:MAG TPA: hypothetical protein VLJ21_02095 [Candidatus Binatia bacterium]|nr:hypothetical protein [Candidatus Binatia bacterium]